MSNRLIRGAVLGSPISHSLSPVLHNKAFELLGLVGGYEAIEVQSGDLANFLKERGCEFDYLSLTMPLKEEVLEIAQTSHIKIDSLSSRIQSVNTLVNSTDGWSATSFTFARRT